MEVLIMLKYFAKGEKYRTLFETGRSHLVKKRWKLMIIMFIKNDDLEIHVP
jgi:hypothetical protein